MASSTAGPRTAPSLSDFEDTLASNASAALSASGSGAPLTRRSRTRTRSKTVTAGSAQREKSAGPSSAGLRAEREEAMPMPNVGLGYLVAYSSGQDGSVSDGGHPKQHSRSSKKSGTLSDSGSIRTAHEGSFTDVEDAKNSRQTADDFSSNKLSTRKRGKSLPRRVFRAGSSSDFSSQSSLPGPLTPVHVGQTVSILDTASSIHGQIRDSMISQHSTTSSSLYPASTASSVHSPSSQYYSDDNALDIGSFDPQLDEVSKFDGDDVSYRLRLLVQNNYFLPPAHAKPSLSDLSLPSTNMPKNVSKSAGPGFLDIFRLGKLKGKLDVANSPDVVNLLPILRTTSDSTTASGWAPPYPTTRSLPHTPLKSDYVRSTQDSNRAARVVVVREKMDDIIRAAKQAEQEMKARADTRPIFPPRGVDDFVDPTDTVDLPPAGPAYPFAFQPSAMVHLGVEQSLNAQMLQDALVPPLASPALWSLDSQEEKWRKNLLEAAVGHSLNDTPNGSSAGESSGASTPVPSPISSAGFSSSSVDHRSPSGYRSPSVEYRSPSSDFRAKLGQPIVDQPLLEREDEQQQASQAREAQNRLFTAKSRRPVRAFTLQPVPSSSRVSLNPPRRVETPSLPLMPLAPPPRKQLVNPLYSLSQTDLPMSASAHVQEKARMVRKSMSSPMLSDSYEAGAGRRRLAMTPSPPPKVDRKTTASPSVMIQDSGKSAFRSHWTLDTATTGSHYSDEDGGGTRYGTPADTDEIDSRPSMTLSIPSHGRPSMSDYSQPSPSPTVSAFRDALLPGQEQMMIPRGNVEDARSSHLPSIFSSFASRYSITSSPRNSSSLRNTVISPPPRSSSSRRDTVISPPPRSSSMSVNSRPITSPTTPRQSMASAPSYGPSSLGHSSPSSGPTSPMQPIFAPPPTTPPLPILLSSSPTTPPFPSPEQRGQSLRPSLSLSVPGGFSTSIRSAPVPSSPIAFFDNIPNALDDLDTSDEESDEESNNGVDVSASTPGSSSVYMDARMNASSSVISVSSSGRSIMRLGNRSSPQLNPSVRSLPTEPLPSFDPNLARNQPITNVPPRRTFFSGRKGKKGVGLVSAFDIQGDDERRSFDSESRVSSYKSGSRPGTGSGGSGTGSRPGTGSGDGHRQPEASTSTAGRDDSLEKFEGMLSKHVQAERDVFKRIASSVPGPKKPRRDM